MPITRADLKISRNYRNRVAFAHHRLFTSMGVGILISGALLTAALVLKSDNLLLLTLAAAVFSAILSCSVLSVGESPKKRLARLVVENRAHREWDEALGYKN